MWTTYFNGPDKNLRIVLGRISEKRMREILAGLKYQRQAIDEIVANDKFDAMYNVEFEKEKK
jgi:hypothetical protein